jgi:hypothetical protein
MDAGRHRQPSLSFPRSRGRPGSVQRRGRRIIADSQIHLHCAGMRAHDGTAEHRGSAGRFD